MDSLKSQPSISTRSKNKAHNTPSKSAAAAPDLSPFNTPTPEKKPQPLMRTRNQGVVMSVNAIRNVAKSLRQSDTDKVSSSVKKQIVSWPVETPVRKSTNVVNKLPERYEMFSEFFNCLDSSIRLLRMKGSMTTFTNICPKIESLTDRRFSYTHLGQLKFLLPEAIVLKKVMIHDERTSCMKPDLHVTLDAGSLKDEGEMKSATGNSRMRKVFRARLLDFVKSHPEGDDIPEEPLPEPFCRKQNLLTATAVESNSLSINETSVNMEFEHTPAVASHLSRSFHKQFSQKASSRLADTSSPVNLMTSKIIQETPTKIIQETPTKIIQETPTKIILETPSKIIQETPTKNPVEPVTLEIIEETPTKITSTPATLITTPALQTPKRCYMKPGDGSKTSPNKLVRRPVPSRSLIFDTPVKNAKEAGCSSVYNDLLDVLPKSLLQSIQDKERKILEEQDPAISQAKRRRDMIAGLPKLFNIICFFFQSVKRSVATKDELVHKILSSHLDIVDRREIEEQLLLLQEIAPKWLSENVTSSGDRLLRIEKLLSTETRARLAEAE